MTPDQKAKRVLRDKQYQLTHKEEIRLNRIFLYSLYGDTKRAQARKSSIKCKERLNNYWKKYRLSNPERILKHKALVKKYRALNKEHLKLKAKQWEQANPQNLKAKKHRYRARFQMGGDLSVEIIQRVYEDNIKKYGTLTCYLCEKLIVFTKDHLEHKIPLSRGGNNAYENLAISCELCNKKKSTKTVEEFQKCKT